MTQAQGLEDIFIGISGIIGAGKTTLAEGLGKNLGLDVYYEPVEDNEYLEDFYQDIKRYSFPMQIYLLNKRFHQHQQIIWQGKGGVQDRTIYEDTVFARMFVEAGLMEKRDYETYLQLFKHMANFMKKPNVIIYLDVNPEIAIQRIHQRARNIEQGIELDYLQRLYQEYEVFIEEISRAIPVVRIDWNEFQDVKDIISAIEREYLNRPFLRGIT